MVVPKKYFASFFARNCHNFMLLENKAICETLPIADTHMEHSELEKVMMFEVRPKEIESSFEERPGRKDRNTGKVMYASRFGDTCIAVETVGDERGHKRNGNPKVVGLSIRRIELRK
jgi:hypothetical protein